MDREVRHLLISLFWILTGAILADSFIPSAIGAERSSVVLVNDTRNGDRIDLYADRNAFCEQVDPGNARMGLRVVYHYRKDHPTQPNVDVEGCYAISGEMVFMIFTDGDQGRSKLSDFHTPGQGKNDI